MRIILFFIVGMISSWVYSQPVTQTIDLKLIKQNQHEWTQDIYFPEITNGEFIAYSIILEGKGISSEYLKINLKNKTKKINIPPFGEDPYQTDRYVSELMYIEADAAGWAQLMITTSNDLDLNYVTGKIRMFFSNQSTALSTNESPKTIETRNKCACPLPGFVGRSDWGKDFQLNSNIYHPPATYTQVTHLIVHHSAGTNLSNNWSSVVASIFDFHVNSNGWQDVGYNWLIDPNGIIYEGRGGGDNVRGAHMCGYNNNTLGVCMLGNFETAEPMPAALLSLKKLLVWKACKEGISTDGSSNIVSYSGHMHHISGHKDGCAPNYTSCPGINLYSQLNALRLDATSYTQTTCLPSGNVDISNKQITIFPNPTFDHVVFLGLETNNDNNINIYNSHGIFISKRTIKSDLPELDMSDLPQGLYLLRIENPNQVQPFKIIKH